jgi:hypothetical protein
VDIFTDASGAVFAAPEGNTLHEGEVQNTQDESIATAFFVVRQADLIM